jgi:hypothetical protein
MQKAARPFPVLRWVAVLWMIVWLPAYVRVWGWANLLHLCDAAVILTCVGLWFGSARLLSSQAVNALLPGVLWLLNVCWRIAAGHFLVSGSEYMWETQYPLWVRLLSFFHVVLPGVLLWAVWKLGYDRSGLALQTAIAAILLLASRFLSDALDMNYAYRDPVFNRTWGPPAVHLGVILLGAVVLLYLPTHLMLARLFSGQRSHQASLVSSNLPSRPQ